MSEDIECTQVMLDINWGALEAGGYITKELYIKNSGNVEITLSLNTLNWRPVTAVDYLRFTWNYDGKPLMSGKIVIVVLTLEVDSAIRDINDFSFDLEIRGSTL